MAEHPGRGVPAAGTAGQGPGELNQVHTAAFALAALCGKDAGGRACTGLKPAGALTPAHNQLREVALLLGWLSLVREGCSQVTLPCKAISKQNESRQ